MWIASCTRFVPGRLCVATNPFPGTQGSIGSALGRATPNVYTDRALVIACASCEGRSTVLGACGAARCTRGLRGSRWSTVPRASPPTVCVVSLARPALLCASCSFRSPCEAPCLSHTLTPFAQRGPPLAQSWDAALVRAGADLEPRRSQHTRASWPSAVWCGACSSKKERQLERHSSRSRAHRQRQKRRRRTRTDTARTGTAHTHRHHRTPRPPPPHRPPRPRTLCPTVSWWPSEI